MTIPHATMSNGNHLDGLIFFSNRLLGSSNAAYVKKNTVTARTDSEFITSYLMR